MAKWSVAGPRGSTTTEKMLSPGAEAGVVAASASKYTIATARGARPWSAQRIAQPEGQRTAAQVVDDDAAAAAGQHQRMGPAEAAPRARDHRDLAIELEHHRSWSRCARVQRWQRGTAVS